RISQEGALSQLHRLAADIVDLSAALGQESAQMALSELLKRLEQLAEQQRSLNDRAQQAGSGNPLLSELALQQSIVRAALEKLMRGAGRELSDRLGGVPQDMDEVAQDLKDLRLTPKTITRQRDILHKMLDAQRSLYTKQQLSHERVAERPKPYKPAPSPPKLVEQAPPRLKLPESGRPFRPPVPEAFRGLASAYENRLQKSR
ncbi:MAG: hypothetical protein H5T86_13570, partial [Armatimonadetes bacterium]|nr:hypothetical protein [Armatimonadota bacterium]